MSSDDKQKTALVIDDEEEICSFLSEYLEEQHFKSYCAVTIDQSLEIAEKEKIDVIFLDNNLLNSIRGVDYIPRFKYLNPECKVFMLTANSKPEVIEKAVERGIEGYLLKPFDFELFDEIIQKIINDNDTKGN